MNKSPNLLQTPRLLGRPLQQGDFPFLRRIHTNPSAMAELGGVRDEFQSQQNLDWNLRHWRNHGFGLWIFSLKEKNVDFGLIGFRQIDFLGRTEADLAFMLLPEYWGQGLATESCQEAITVAKTHFNLASLIAKTRTTNHRSQQVIKKLEFNLEREILDYGFPHFQYRIHF